MKKNFKFLIALCLSATFTTVVFGSDFNMSFMYGGTSHQYKNYLETSENYLNFVSPDYFNLSNIGKLSINENFDEDFVSTAHSNGIKVVPYLTTNRDKTIASETLKNGSILAVDLAREIKDKNLDGVTIDFSNLTNENVSDFTNFLKTVRTSLPDKILNVSISPDLNSYNNTNMNLYDYKQIGEIADNVIIMSFDESAGQTTPGPISNNEYLTNTIERLIKDIPSEKIVLGVSFHGRYWNTNNSDVAKNITSSDINNLLQNYTATKEYDEDTKHYKANVSILENDIVPKIWGGDTLPAGNYEIWYEDASALDSKKELVNKYHLKGIATWSLGEEDIQIWNKFKDEDFTQVNKNLDKELPKLEVVYDFSALGKDEQATLVSDDINSLVAETTKRTWTTERDPDTGANKDTIVIETIEDENNTNNNMYDNNYDTQNSNNTLTPNSYNNNYAPNTNYYDNTMNEKNAINPANNINPNNENINNRTNRTRNDSNLSYDPMYNVDYLPENTTIPRNPNNNVRINEPAINMPSTAVTPNTVLPNTTVPNTNITNVPNVNTNTVPNVNTNTLPNVTTVPNRVLPSATSTNPRGTTKISINERTTSENELGNDLDNQETAETFSYDDNKNTLTQDNQSTLTQDNSVNDKNALTNVAPETILFDDEEGTENLTTPSPSRFDQIDTQGLNEQTNVNNNNNTEQNTNNVFDQRDTASNVGSNMQDNSQLKLAKQTVFNDTSYSETDFLNEQYVRRDKAVSVLMDKIDASFTPSSNNVTFKDIEGNEYANNILKALNYNYITAENDFRPDAYITKKDLVNIIDKMYDLPNNVNFNKAPFSDLNKEADPDSYYAINKLYEHGIIKGDSDNKFYPNDNLTREEFVEILYNLKDAKLKPVGGYTATMNIIFDRVFGAK